MLPEQPLSPLYYRDNFCRLCETVQSQYADILSHDEIEHLQSFHAASLDAQCLYVRLISRTGPLFRTSKLHYPEISDMAAALLELVNGALVVPYEVLDIDDLAALYTRKELEEMFCDRLASQALPKKATTKGDLINAIDALELTSEDIAHYRATVDSGEIVSPSGEETVALLQLLFFGNRHQSLTQFVLEDLGVAKFYPYALHPEHRLFSCRESVEEYLCCAELADARYALLDNDQAEALPELAREVLRFNVRFESTRQRWNKLCNRLARDLERQQDWEQALALYARSQSHPARERSARILEKTEQWQSASAVCEAILSQPLNEAEHEAAQKIGPRLLKKLNGTRTKRHRDAFDELQLCIVQGEGSVEQLAALELEHYWSRVHYVENSLMNALFGLAFWPVIFADRPGVFHHPFQRAPADMYDGAFQSNREALVKKRFELLEAEDLARLIGEAYDEYCLYQNHWVDWRFIDKEMLEEAVRVIPSEHLTAIWKRILFDPQENRTGFPDLIAFGERAGEYALIEVKGPGDALQNNQKRWLRFFQENAIPAKVAWVSWHEQQND
ncbi:MAG: VRR-NUC domain-containing protein [Halioglobus sp.]